jgi:predicted glycosyltransferase
VFYPGFKEELYLGEFSPDPHVLRHLGLRRETGQTLAVVRTAPWGATYHRNANALFPTVLARLDRDERVLTVVLTRGSADRDALRQLELKRCVVPDRAVDSRSLMAAADVVVGAGGTMTREAALLGVPTWTVFVGREAAADRELIARGRLRRLASPEQLDAVRTRERSPGDLGERRRRGVELTSLFASATVDAGVVGRA